MSPRPTSPSADLRRLQQEGYAIEVRDGFLLVHHIPYVDRDRRVRYGVLVSALEMAGDVTAPPRDHVARFHGSVPCDQNGIPLDKIIHGRAVECLADGIEVAFSFSSKPLSGAYTDYYDKMTTYAAILSSPARALDPDATATPFPLAADRPEEAVFCYPDTASSRAGIGMVTRRLAGHKVAIVGLGGTGSYILDLVAKTPVEQIHLYDGDRFLSHNAFRAPGAPSIEDLRSAPTKVGYLASTYANMHRGIVAHEEFLDESNVDELAGMDFVFIAMDRGGPKRLLVERLEQHGIPFIDVGMGVQEVDGQLTGLLRVTTSTPDQRRHVHERQRIAFVDDGGDNAYATNIQIADLNMMNAAVAVIRWKKWCGFYLDLEGEHSSVYQIDGNALINEDRPDTAPSLSGEDAA